MGHAMRRAATDLTDPSATINPAGDSAAVYSDAAYGVGEVLEQLKRWDRRQGQGPTTRRSRREF